MTRRVLRLTTQRCIDYRQYIIIDYSIHVVFYQLFMHNDAYLELLLEGAKEIVHMLNTIN